MTTLDLAKRQQTRIARARRAVSAAVQKRGRVKLDGLLGDVHFYLICWARIAKLSKFIRSKTKWRRVGMVLRRYARDLDDMVEARDHMEHFEERLPGGPKRASLKTPGDLFNLAGDWMTFGGDRFDVGPKGMSTLGEFVRELNLALVYDALDILAGHDTDLLVRRLRQAHTDVQLPLLIQEGRISVREESRQTCRS